MTHDQLLLRAVDAARICGVACVTFRRWNSSGRIPQSLKIGGARVWRKAELVAWIEAGSPDREKWEASQKAVGANPSPRTKGACKL